MLGNVAPALAEPREPRSGWGESAGSSPSGLAAKKVRLLPLRSDALTRALARGDVTRGQYALERAASLFDLRSVRARFGSVQRVDPHLATIVLRDLVASVHELDGVDKARALAVLARPDDGASDPFGDGYSVASEVGCTTHICLHWVESTTDAPPLEDADASGRPDWVEVNAGVLEQVWTTEVTTYGYRAPKSDITSSNSGPDGRIDVYLADIGDDHLFGYCFTDDPNAINNNFPPYDVSAYCVLDNDFSAAQFGPGASGLTGLRATAAHEFFHAVQFAYDVLDDAWFMESTATWIEDEVFDNVNQNRDYLSTSSLRRGFVPVDFGDTRRFFLYGNWIFIRFLTEYFGRRTNADPTTVRDAWEWADGSSGAPDYYSMQALERAARERDKELQDAFADFGAFNLAPRRFYEEGGAYPTPLIDRSFALSASRSDTGWWSITTDHMTNRYFVFRPRTGIPRTSTLRLLVDATARSTMPKATAVVFRKNGAVRYSLIRLDRRGDGARSVPFGRGVVKRVVLVLTNASTRYANCFSAGSPFSCSGRPIDDNARYLFRAVVP